MDDNCYSPVVRCKLICCFVLSPTRASFALHESNGTYTAAGTGAEERCALGRHL
jgi:hypothetical protein